MQKSIAIAIATCLSVLWCGTAWAQNGPIAERTRAVSIDAAAEKLMIEQSPVYKAVQRGVDVLAQNGLKAEDDPSVFVFDANAQKPAGTGKTIAIQVGTLNQSFLKMLAIGAEKATREGDTLLVYSYEQEGERQLQQVESMVARRVDAILVQPQDPSAAFASSRVAHAAGIPFISIDVRLADEQYTAGTFLGDDYAIGYYGGLQLAKAYYEKHGNYNAKIMVYNVMSNTVLVVRQRGFLDAIALHPEMEIVAQPEGMWTTEAALGPISDALAVNPQVDAFWTFNEPCTIAAVQVFREAGRDDIIVSTNEATSWVVKMMDEGRVHGGLDLLPYAMGFGAIGMAYNAIEGKDFAKQQFVAQIPLFPNNYKELGVTYKVETDLLADWKPVNGAE